jgi:hypothetical protein
MASVVYNEFKRASAAGEIDLNADDIRVRLVMSNTTCDSENDGVVSISDITTVDVADAGSYADVALSGEAVNKDDGNDRAEFDANDAVFSGLGGDATRNYVGVLVYKYVDGTDANDLVIAYIEFSSPLVKEATQVTVQWDAEGILQLA